MTENDALFQVVVEGVERHGPLAPLLEAVGVPWNTFMDWVRADPNKADRLARARESWAERLVEDCPRVANDDQLSPKAARVIIDTNLRLAALLAPRRFSQQALDRIVAPTDDTAPQSAQELAATLLKAISRTGRMALPPPDADDGDVEDAEYHDA